MTTSRIFLFALILSSATAKAADLAKCTLIDRISNEALEITIPQRQNDYVNQTNNFEFKVGARVLAGKGVKVIEYAITRNSDQAQSQVYFFQDEPDLVLLEFRQGVGRGTSLASIRCTQI